MIQGHNFCTGHYIINTTIKIASNPLPRLPKRFSTGLQVQTAGKAYWKSWSSCIIELQWNCCNYTQFCSDNESILTVIPNVTLRTTEVIVFFFLTITSILVKNSWSVYFDKFYQRNKHKVIFFRYFGTLSRKCVWRYVQWRINHFASYDDIK